MNDIDQRMAALEARFAALERALSAQIPAPAQPRTRLSPVQTRPIHRATAAQPTPPPLRSTSTKPPLAPKPRTVDPITATWLMGWCAGITFVLAALYFLKLVYDMGWLTPVRQVAIAYIAATALIAFGFVAEKKDRYYAAYLPAVGLVVLYLTTFVAQLAYALISPIIALSITGVITLLGIWLGRHYQMTVYVIFAAIGVYVAPLLVHVQQQRLIDLVVYYSAWSLLFSFCAVQESRRLTYLLPMYLAILGFDAAFRSGSDEWGLAAIYQLVQFLIFAVTTVIFSVKNKSPMQRGEALPHGIALLLFYFIQYANLRAHLPDQVNYYALLSGVVVYVLYAIAKRLRQDNEEFRAGAVLVSFYCSFVGVHAVFFGLVSWDWLPWAALLTPFIYLGLRHLMAAADDAADILLPVSIACGLVFLTGFLMSLGNVIDRSSGASQQESIALLCYAFMLYGVYWKFRGHREGSAWPVVPLYAGHFAFLSVLRMWLDQGIYLSGLWALYGVLLLVFALMIKDKVIGKSALVLFCAAAFKVFFFDLSGSNSLTRVLVLVVVSSCLYAGGWLYQALIRKKEEA